MMDGIDLIYIIRQNDAFVTRSLMSIVLLEILDIDLLFNMHLAIGVPEVQSE
jgi:hypothetical protein